MVGPIQFVTRGFIDFFGITQPTPQQERQAQWFICGLLALIVVFAAAVFSILVVVFRTSVVGTGDTTGARSVVTLEDDLLFVPAEAG